jgi:hypothetical protein
VSAVGDPLKLTAHDHATGAVVLSDATANADRSSTA